MNMPLQAAVTYYLTESNSLADNINYGTVTIEADNTTGEVTFTVVVNTAPYGNSGFDNFGLQTFGFNSLLSDADFTITGLPTGWTYSGAPPGSEDGFGKYLINTDGAGGLRQSTLTFTVLTDNIADATVANFATTDNGTSNPSDHFFAGHVAGFPVTSGFTSHYIAGSGTTPPPETTPGVPEPASLAIWALGMVAAGFGARRMRKAK
jgi:hypothetical protein